MARARSVADALRGRSRTASRSLDVSRTWLSRSAALETGRPAERTAFHVRSRIDWYERRLGDIGPYPKRGRHDDLQSLAGIAAGVISAVYVGTDPVDAASTTLVLVLGAFVLAQYPLYKMIGVGDFGVKDNLYVAFLTFTLWFISYTVLATSGVELVV